MLQEVFQFVPFDIGSGWLRAQLIKDFVMLGHVCPSCRESNVTEKWLHRNRRLLIFKTPIGDVEMTWYLKFGEDLAIAKGLFYSRQPLQLLGAQINGAGPQSILADDLYPGNQPKSLTGQACRFGLTRPSETTQAVEAALVAATGSNSS